MPGHRGAGGDPPPVQPVLHQAADAAGVAYGWHSYVVGTHAWKYGDRSLKDYLPRLMRFFRTGR